jgi:tetratricopeptide (TPR) repeat protein
MVFVGSMAFGQSSKVQSAYNYLKNGKLDKAKQNIDLAMKHEKTMTKAKTWFYAGNIYLNIYMSDNEEYRALSDNALEVAYDAYKKTQQYDEKQEFANQLLINLNIIAEQYYNQAVGYFNAGEYANSSNSFLTAKEINESFGGVDSLATYNAAITAEFAGDTAKALELYSNMIDLEYTQPNLYASVANIYKSQNKLDEALEVIKLGRERFPTDFNNIIAETNIYLAMGDSEAALANLELALVQVQDNPTIFFAVGSQYNIIVDDTSKTAEIRASAFENAEKAYKSAIALDEAYFDANYNLGALYVNEAAELITIANALPLDETAQYDELKTQANDMLAAAVPYLEKAVEIRPDDMGTLISLKEIYTRLNMMEKLQEINTKLEGSEE